MTQRPVTPERTAQRPPSTEATAVASEAGDHEYMPDQADHPTDDAGVDEADSAMPLGRMEDHADHETEADTGSAPP